MFQLWPPSCILHRFGWGLSAMIYIIKMPVIWAFCTLHSLFPPPKKKKTDMYIQRDIPKRPKIDANCNALEVHSETSWSPNKIAERPTIIYVDIHMYICMYVHKGPGAGTLGMRWYEHRGASESAVLPEGEVASGLHCAHRTCECRVQVHAVTQTRTHRWVAAAKCFFPGAIYNMHPVADPIRSNPIRLDPILRHYDYDARHDDAFAEFPDRRVPCTRVVFRCSIIK